ncbi:MAG TPA: 3-deoxy-7-phosphoheptulonate synthase [Anaeromyxobacter sp.]
MHEDPTAPALPAPATLADVRASIDHLDRRIVELLAARRDHALHAARLKGAGAAKDPARERQVLAHVAALARGSGLEPDLVEGLWKYLMSALVRAELAAEGAPPPETGRPNVAALDALPSPEELKQRVPLSPGAAASVDGGRRGVEAILDGTDPRLLVVVGPCSIHDTEAGLDYARRLRALAGEVSDTLLLVMRVYLEKPRTSVGWEGFTNDPRLDGSFRVAEGMERGRRFLRDVAELGLPIGTEALDPIAPQYQGDLVSWNAIGARTAASQPHRNLASGLSTPIGFKNGTDGDVEVAVNAILAASRPHAFLGIDERGRSAAIRTRGNRHGHLVLRGGGGRPNFDSVSVSLAEQALARAGVPGRIVIDCSHANSWKDPSLQPYVVRDAVAQVRHGNASIAGLMIESFLEQGSQPIGDPSHLRYGCSVTDGCLGWEPTADVLRAARAALRPVVSARRARSR